MKPIHGGFWVLILMICAPAPGQVSSLDLQLKQQVAAAREVGARGRRGGAVPTRLNATEARQKFLEVERIARLPADQLKQQLPMVYDQLNLRYPQIFDELAGNTALPAKLLMDRLSQRAMPNPGLMDWGKELDEAAPRMTPERMADTIVNNHSVRVLYTAARRRLAYVLLTHKAELTGFVEEDLRTSTGDSTWRAFGAIHDLELSEFVPRSIDIYLAGGPIADSAYYAISWVASDSAAAKKLIDHVERDPASLKVNAELIEAMLRNQPSDKRLVALVNSPDLETRYAAAVALRETHDETMLVMAPKLMEDAEKSIREVGICIVASSTTEQFSKARPTLIKLLDWPDKVIQLLAARKLADQKDPAAGPVVLRFLNDQQLTPRERSDAGVVVHVLLGWDMRVDTQQWDQNVFVISQVQEWIKSHPDTVK